MSNAINSFDDGDQMNRCSSKALREAFTHATTSGKQEGWKPTAADLLLQLQVIDGELTFEGAIGKIVADAGKDD